jgi:hypothetical protein
MPFLKTSFVTLFALLFGLLLKAQTVYITPSGTKYHLASCRMVKNVSKEITIIEAGERGLSPCKICSPQDISSSNTFTIHKARGQGKSVRCSGLTIAGTRCKHMTSIADRFCFQHLK